MPEATATLDVSAASSAAAAAAQPAEAPYQSGKSMQGMADAMDGLGKIAKLEDASINQPSPLKRGPQAQPEAKTEPAKEAPKAEPAKVDAPKTEPAKAKKPADFLREELDKWKSEAEKAKAEFEEYKKRPAPEDTEKAELKQRYEAIEKKYKEVEDNLRFTNYERSAEYKEKYQKPIEDAFGNAYREIKQLEVTGADGNTRLATEDDFNAIARLNTADAIRVSRELFGDAATEVLAHRRAIHALNDQRNKALDEFRAHGAEREKQMSEQRQKQFEELNGKVRSVFAKTFEETTASKADYLKPREGDDEGNKLLQAAQEEAAKAFDFSGKIPPEEQAARHAKTWFKAAAFDRLERDYSRQSAKIAELEEQLRQYSNSEPTRRGDGSTDPSTKPSGSSMDIAMDGLNRIGKPMR